MPAPHEISRRIRRAIDRDGLRADVLADVTIAVSTGGSASVRQDGAISQGKVRPDRTRATHRQEAP